MTFSEWIDRAMSNGGFGSFGHVPSNYRVRLHTRQNIKAGLVPAFTYKGKRISMRKAAALWSDKGYEAS